MSKKGSPISSWQGGFGAKNNKQNHITNFYNVAQCRQLPAHVLNKGTVSQYARSFAKSILVTLTLWQLLPLTWANRILGGLRND